MSASDTQESQIDHNLHGADATVPFHALDDDVFDAQIGVNQAVRFSKPKMRGLSFIPFTMNTHEFGYI